MSVYVDPLVNYGGSATFRWTDSCHMWADTEDELHAFAAFIGLKRSWFQPPKGKGRIRLPHYDLNAGRRKAALMAGAVALDREATVACWRRLGYMTVKAESEAAR